MVHQNPDARRVLLQKSLTGVNTLEDAKAMLDDVKLPDYSENRAFFDPQGSLVNYFTIYQTAQGIWRKIGKIKDVYQPHQTVDTRFIEATAEWFPQSAASSARSPSSTSRHPPKPAAAPILTKTVSIYFPTGSSTLDENAKAVLDTQVVDLAATFGSAYMRIAGNTDNVGGRDANVRLSRARAEAVTRYLMSKGFDREQVRGAGQRARQAGGQQRQRRGARPEPAHRLRGDPPFDGRPRGRLQRAARAGAAGVVTFFGLGACSPTPGLIPAVILPSPTEVLKAFPVLHFEEALVRSALASLLPRDGWASCWRPWWRSRWGCSWAPSRR